MEIRKATIIDKGALLKALDEFNDFANSLNADWDGKHSSYSRENSAELFEKIVNSENSCLFIAREKDAVVGFLEVHAVPRLRKAKYYGEIESMFLRKSYRGSGLAKLLMDKAIEWGKKKELDCLRLYSGHELKRAHSFYEKMGFKHAGRTYKLSSF